MSGISKKVHQSVVDELNLESKAKVEAIRDLNASDHVNRNLQAIITKKEKQLKTESNMYQNASNERDISEGMNKKYRSKIGRLEEKLKQNEEAYFKLRTEKERKRNDKREMELEKIITVLKHDLELAKKVAEQINEREDKMQNASKDLIKKHNQAIQLKELYEEQLKNVRKEAAKDREENRCEVERLIGELRGANFCFQKLVQEIFEQKGSAE
jgi:hypothetical protein